MTDKVEQVEVTLSQRIEGLTGENIKEKFSNIDSQLASIKERQD